MKQFKTLVALVLALALTFSLVGAAFASAPVNNPSFDTPIKITNLKEGDKVTLYQVIKWDGFWAPTEDFATALPQASVDVLVGQNHETGVKSTPAGLTDAYINAIIGAAPSATAVAGPTEVGSNGEYSYTATAAGMYYALVTPVDGTMIYKPIFISSDYDAADGTDTLAVTAAKYETVTINKQATAQTNNQDAGATSTYAGQAAEANSYNTVGIGDTVDFQITTTIPLFPASYTNPIFNVSDTLNGLTLKHDTGEIKVYAGNTELTLGEAYTLDPVATDTAFTVKFDADYIKGLTASQPIKVTYQGIVDNTATANVNAKENTATVTFSNNPNDTVGANKLEDETRHYTFSIDALVNGSRHGTDLIKVGVDKDGNEITATVELPNANWAGVLQGATFDLYYANADGTAASTTKARENLVSDGQGLIEINGLDAGTYFLRETSAPDGFVKSNTDAKIEIIPTFTTKTVAAHQETTNGITVTVPEYTYAVLASYTIKINGALTSTYTVTNDAISANDDDQIAAGSSNGNPSADTLGKITNMSGVELPSTGGIGTTIFYVAGIVLVLGAAAIIVARRKAEQE